MKRLGFAAILCAACVAPANATVTPLYGGGVVSEIEETTLNVSNGGNILYQPSSWGSDASVEQSGTAAEDDPAAFGRPAASAAAFGRAAASVAWTSNSAASGSVSTFTQVSYTNYGWGDSFARASFGYTFQTDTALNFTFNYDVLAGGANYLGYVPALQFDLVTYADDPDETFLSETVIYLTGGVGTLHFTLNPGRAGFSFASANYQSGFFNETDSYPYPYNTGFPPQPPAATFYAGASATFDFTLTPASVPEPASWALVLSGFGLIGGSMRSGKRSKAITARNFQ